MKTKTASLDSKFNTINKHIAKEMKRLHVPGIAIGIYCKDKEWTAGFGVTNLEHPLPITPDTLFQTGSISKTFTGTLLMMLAEQGKVDVTCDFCNRAYAFSAQECRVLFAPERADATGNRGS